MLNINNNKTLEICEDDLFDILEDDINSINDINDISDTNNINNMNNINIINNINHNKKYNMIKHNIKNDICYSCNKNNLVENYTDGIIVCINCGAVQDNITDMSLEGKNYDDCKKTNTRDMITSNIFLPESSMSTTIACSNHNRIKRLQTWYTMPYKERTLHDVLVEINKKCQNGKILKCIEDDAKILYKKISETIDNESKKNVIIRGKNRRGLIAACVFFACKKKSDTRSPKEIASLFGLKDTEVARGCKVFMRLKKNNKFDYELRSSTPEHFIKRFCCDLNISAYTNDLLKIAINIQKINIGSVHTPVSIATGSILLGSDIYKLNITKKMISEKFRVSDVTINKAYNSILKYKDILINDNMIEIILKYKEDFKKNELRPYDLVKKYNDIVGNKKIQDFTIEEHMKYAIKKQYELYDRIYKTNQLYLNLIKLFKHKDDFIKKNEQKLCDLVKKNGINENNINMIL